MHLPHPIDIDLLAFCASGRFDFIKLGQTKEWILANFLDPDNFGPELLSPRWPIWTYGHLEFHFDADNRLTTIYTDYIADLAQNNRLRMKPWIFEQVDRLTLLYVLSALNQEGIDYEKKTGPFGDVELHLRSGLRFSFSPPDGPAAGPNDCRLTALYLAE